jgi:hypothetical protein
VRKTEGVEVGINRGGGGAAVVYCTSSGDVILPDTI